MVGALQVAMQIGRAFFVDWSEPTPISLGLFGPRRYPYKPLSPQDLEAALARDRERRKAARKGDVLDDDRAFDDKRSCRRTGRRPLRSRLTCRVPLRAAAFDWDWRSFRCAQTAAAGGLDVLRSSGSYTSSDPAYQELVTTARRVLRERGEDVDSLDSTHLIWRCARACAPWWRGTADRARLLIMPAPSGSATRTRGASG